MENIASKVSEADLAYYNGAMRSYETESSVLVSSSAYLNRADLRALIAQEMLRRNGPDVPNTAFIPNVAKIFMELEDWPRVHQLFEEEKARLPHFKAWLDGRKISLYSPEELKGAKPGTLREVIHDFVVNSGYNMDHFYQGMEIKTDIEYYMKQRTHTHDIEHMITGFETNHLGEIALLAANERAVFRYFKPELAAFFNRISAYLKAKTTMKSALFYPEAYAGEVEAQVIGYEQGGQWKMPLSLLPYNDLLDWQVTDIREEYGVKLSHDPLPWRDSNTLSEDTRFANDDHGTAMAAE